MLYRLFFNNIPPPSYPHHHTFYGFKDIKKLSDSADVLTNTYFISRYAYNDVTNRNRRGKIQITTTRKTIYPTALQYKNINDSRPSPLMPNPIEAHVFTG